MSKNITINFLFRYKITEMKNILTAMSIAAVFSACNSATESKNETTGTATTSASAPAASAPIAQTAPKGKRIIDPVCGMEKDSTWTDYTMYKGDTVWFCAESEKTAFLANPAKYEAKLVK